MQADFCPPAVALDRALHRAVRSDVLLYASVFRQSTRLSAWLAAGGPTGVFAGPAGEPSRPA